MGTSGGQIDHCPTDACNRDWYKDRKDYSDPYRDREISIIGMSLEIFNISSNRNLRFLSYGERKFYFKVKEIFKIKSNSS